MRSRLAAVLLVCLVSSPAGAGEAKVVARVKVHNAAARALENVVVRGHLPLPRDCDGPVAALALRDGEKLLPTQVSVFATYPGADDKHPVGRPEVVHLAAKVSLPPEAFKELEVVQLPAPPSPAPAARPGKSISDWLGAEAPLVVEATDCFGNRYRAEPLAGAAVGGAGQAGPVLRQGVRQSILAPVGDAPAGRPALKRFLRVRVYLTTYAGEDFASLALMIHNGSIDRPNGTVYYRDLRLGLARPMGLHVWRKEYSPAADGEAVQEGGTTWLPCPPPAGDEKVFAMPHGGAAVVRLTVYAPSAEGRAKAFADHAPVFVPVPDGERFSWSNPATARYDAPKYPMPLRLEPDAFDRAGRDAQARYANGRLGWDLVYLRDRPPGARRALGHAMPAGVAYGGMTGGQGIHYVFGVRAALTGHNGLIHLHVLLADRNWDRHRAHLFYDDGRPFTYGRHVAAGDGGKVLDMAYDDRGQPVLKIDDPAAEAQAGQVKAGGLLHPDAERLLKYHNHDDQHLSRLFDAVPAAYLACDPVNRDRLVTLGAQACWKLNLHPIRGRANFGGWGSLFAKKRRTDAAPHQGIGMSREHGWVTHSLGWAMCLSKDRQIRADAGEIAAADVRVRAAGQMPAGNVTIRSPSGKAFGGEYWFTTAWEEGCILADGARSVIHVLDDGRHDQLVRTMKDVYRRVGRWTATAGWNQAARGPAFHVGLRKKGDTALLAKPVLSGNAAFYMGSPFAWYHELTGEALFLDRLRESAGQNTLAAAALRNLGNWSYALHVLQTRGPRQSTEKDGRPPDRIRGEAESPEKPSGGRLR